MTRFMSTQNNQRLSRSGSGTNYNQIKIQSQILVNDVHVLGIQKKAHGWYVTYVKSTHNMHGTKI